MKSCLITIKDTEFKTDVCRHEGELISVDELDGTPDSFVEFALKVKEISTIKHGDIVEVSNVTWHRHSDLTSKSKEILLMFHSIDPDGEWLCEFRLDGKIDISHPWIEFLKDTNKRFYEEDEEDSLNEEEIAWLMKNYSPPVKK